MFFRDKPVVMIWMCFVHFVCIAIVYMVIIWFVLWRLDMCLGGRNHWHLWPGCDRFYRWTLERVRATKGTREMESTGAVVPPQFCCGCPFWMFVEKIHPDNFLVSCCNGKSLQFSHLKRKDVLAPEMLEDLWSWGKLCVFPKGREPQNP